MANTRPSVSRNGELAVFVNAQNDLCLSVTDGGWEDGLGVPGLMASVAMSADSQLFGFVFRDALGNPDNRISVIDLETDEARTFTLKAPSYDGVTTDTILHADSMDFVFDGQYVIYDAQNAVTFADGSQFRRWSLYALNLETGTNSVLTRPLRGFHVAFPAMSQTSDNFLTFAVFDEARKQSTVSAGNLNTGDPVSIATVADSYDVPGYTGDGSALVYSQRDTSVSTGFSLGSQSLAADRITPQGQASVWLRNGDYGVISRRSDLTDALRESLLGFVPERYWTVLRLGM